MKFWRQTDYIVCVFVLNPLIFPYRGNRTWALSSACKTDQGDFTDWMPFLPSNLMKKVSSNTEALSANN